MNRISASGLMVALAVCVVAPGSDAAEGLGKSAEGKVAAASLAEQPRASVVPNVPATAQGRTVSLQGEIVLRDKDAKHSSTLYLRVKEADGRVWLVSVVPSVTAVTKDGAKASTDLLTEGAQVEATFAHSGDNVPVASSITILPAAQ